MRRAAVTALSLAICSGLLAGCGAAASAGITVTGTVEDSTVSVAVPTLALSPTKAASTLGLGSTVGVTSMAVRVGDSVRAGQVVAGLDVGIIQAKLTDAQADQDAAKAQVDVLDAAIDATYDKAWEVADAKKKLNKAIKELKKNRTKLEKAQKEAKKARPQLAKQLKQAQALLAKYPPVAVKGIPTKKELQAAIKKLKAAIKKIDAGLKEMKKALPKLDKALKTANKSLKKLNDAAADIVDARATLKDAKAVAELSAGASSIPIQLVQARLSVGEVTAPESGVVVYAASVGDQLAPGAALVTIRPSRPSTITAWLSPAQAAQVCLGDAAQLVGDWMPEGTAEAAKLTRFADSYAYPPTNVTTDEIHLTTALQVEFTATEAQLPAGVPVDITLAGCHLVASSLETNG
jgi:multidrug resistance efflux pump